MNFTFRNKLLLSFIALTLVNGAIFSAISISNAKANVKKHIRSTVLSIASTAANAVDGDLHETIKSAADQDSDVYRKFEKQFREIRDANRRDDVHAMYVYTARQSKKDPLIWEYVVDGEEPGENKSNFGDHVMWEPLENGEPALKLGEAYAFDDFLTDDFGTWLSAYAPIRDSSGKIVAMLGADLAATDVKSEVNVAILSLLPGFLTSLIVFGIAALFLSSWISKPLKEIVTGLTKIGRGHLHYKMDDTRKDEFGEINGAINEMAGSLLERDALKGALSRYVSQDAVQNLIKSGEFPTFRGNRKKMTLLMCDISNLETLSDTISPGKLVEMLNLYFDHLVGAVFKHHGTIDKLPGDGLSAVFGALGNEADQEKLAIHAALDLIAENEALNKKWKLTGMDGFQLNIGIHTGEAIFGNIGSDHRVEFTVVGRTMKIASAVGSLNAQFHTRVLVSETTQNSISKDFPFIDVGEIQIGAEQSPLHLFTLKNLLTPEVLARIDSLAKDSE